MARLRDVYKGARFYRLTVMGLPFKKYEKNCNFVDVKCDCGNEREVRVTDLGRPHHSISCGCYIKEIHRKLFKEKNPSRKPVICIETGEIFPSAREASKSMGLSNPCVHEAIKRKGKAGGYRWQYCSKERRRIGQ